MVLVFKYFLRVGEIADTHSLRQMRECPFFSLVMEEYEQRVMIVTYKPANGRSDMGKDIAYIRENLFKKHGAKNIKGLTIYTDEMCQNSI